MFNRGVILAHTSPAFFGEAQYPPTHDNPYSQSGFVMHLDFLPPYTPLQYPRTHYID